MWRDVDPRPEERERPDLSRGTGSTEDRSESASNDPRDVFSRDLDLPRGSTRRPVRDRDRSVDLRESEVRILAMTGAFRVVPARDLLEPQGRPSNARQGELRRLREEGLIEARPYVVGREKTSLVTLTERGRELLDRHRSARRNAPRQEFYAGVVKPRELAHDAQLYRAYLHAAARLRRSGSTVRRVALDYELTLAGRPVRSRSRGQPPTDHGPLDPVIRRSGAAPRLLPNTTGVGIGHVLHPPLATSVAQVAAFAPRAGRPAGGVCHARRIHTPTTHQPVANEPERRSSCSLAKRRPPRRPACAGSQRTWPHVDACVVRGVARRTSHQ
jgi:DNA-binding MarR family transcriptional regulator